MTGDTIQVSEMWPGMVVTSPLNSLFKRAVLSTEPYNHERIPGGIKVSFTDGAWLVARPNEVWGLEFAPTQEVLK